MISLATSIPSLESRIRLPSRRTIPSAMKGARPGANRPQASRPYRRADRRDVDAPCKAQAGKERFFRSFQGGKSAGFDRKRSSLDDSLNVVLGCGDILPTNAVAG